MARPRKDQTHRLPTYNTARKCWRLRIHQHHGEKTFDWPAPESANCPPNIVAAAVAVQDQWRQLVADWPISRADVKCRSSTMSIEETIPYRGFTIVKQAITGIDQDKPPICRFTIYGPDGQKLDQKMTLADAEADIDKRIP